MFPESVPPAMVAEVFEVAGADDDTVLSSVPPPPERPQPRLSRPWSKPPAPHPPHPSRPPVAPAPIEETDALELSSDALEDDAPPTVATASSARGAWLAVAGVALVAGAALGVRSCSAAHENEAPAARARAVSGAGELR
ncbi:MAG TPA: hypothetical protein VMI54_21360 [Polyangiaceae bacterium]|nr:hypothetical protein [Polyangiaceae bacterium]